MGIQVLGNKKPPLMPLTGKSRTADTGSVTSNNVPITVLELSGFSGVINKITNNRTLGTNPTTWRTYITVDDNPRELFTEVTSSASQGTAYIFGNDSSKEETPIYFEKYIKFEVESTSGTTGAAVSYRLEPGK